MAAGVIYWAAWRILPGYLGYELVPRKETLEDGTVAHPSGFVPPTGETAFHPLAAKPEDAARRPWTEVLAKKSEAGGEGRGFHASAVARARAMPGRTVAERLSYVRELEEAVAEVMRKGE